MSQMFPANFLKKEDVPHPTRAVIKSVTMEEVTGDSGKEMKATLHFQGDIKPMILNKGNATTISETYGDDSDAWLGKTIEVFADPGVMFGGKKVGGLRVRVPSQQQQHTPAPITNGATDQLWDYSDGTVLTARQTTGQVLVFLDEMLDQNIPLTKIRVRPAGSKEAPVTADVWRRANDTTAGQGAGMPSTSSPIPF